MVEKCKNPDCKKSGYRMRENAEYCTNKCKRKHEKALAKEKIEEQELVLEIVEKPKFRQLNMFGNDD